MGPLLKETLQSTNSYKNKKYFFPFSVLFSEISVIVFLTHGQRGEGDWVEAVSLSLSLSNKYTLKIIILVCKIQGNFMKT